MSTVDTLKIEILNLLKTKGDGRSFAELEELPGFSGPKAMEVGSRNVFLWFHCSTEAIEAVSQLCQEQKIRIQDTHPLVYHADGSIPQYPIGALDGRYQKPHWCPAQILKGPKFGQ